MALSVYISNNNIYSYMQKGLVNLQDKITPNKMVLNYLIDLNNKLEW